MDTAKEKIKHAVEFYKKNQNEEYLAFIEQMKATKHLKNKFGETKGTDFIKRELLEYPAKVYSLLNNALDEIELAWFKSLDGVKWFGRTYPEFLKVKL